MSATLIFIFYPLCHISLSRSSPSLPERWKISFNSKVKLWFLSSFGGGREIKNVTFSLLAAWPSFTKSRMVAKWIYLSRKEVVLFWPDNLSTKHWKPRESMWVLWGDGRDPLVHLVHFPIWRRSTHNIAIGQCQSFSFCRAMLCKRNLCPCLSVCVCVYVSVTCVHSVKTIKHIFDFFHHSSLSIPNGMTIFWREPLPPNRGVKCTWGRQKSRFWAYIWLHCPAGLTAS